ncbi:putative holin-like toxin [Lentibacillus jeotgali]|nr:putative holin-like toxin [Lentibacillus jeotgali]
MIVYESLIVMISFAVLVVAILSEKNNHPVSLASI